MIHLDILGLFSIFWSIPNFVLPPVFDSDVFLIFSGFFQHFRCFPTTLRCDLGQKDLRNLLRRPNHHHRRRYQNSQLLMFHLNFRFFNFWFLFYLRFISNYWLFLFQQICYLRISRHSLALFHYRPFRHSKAIERPRYLEDLLDSDIAKVAEEKSKICWPSRTWATMFSW